MSKEIANRIARRRERGGRCSHQQLNRSARITQSIRARRNHWTDRAIDVAGVARCVGKADAPALGCGENDAPTLEVFQECTVAAARPRAR